MAREVHLNAPSATVRAPGAACTASTHTAMLAGAARSPGNQGTPCKLQLVAALTSLHLKPKQLVRAKREFPRALWLDT